MNSYLTKVILLTFLVMQASCDIAFKRKSSTDQNTYPKQSTEIKLSKKDVVKKKKSSKTPLKINNTGIITAYYSNPVNAVVRKDMIAHTSISKVQESKLELGKIIPRDIQVMPLPLELEKILTALPLHVIRVQVGTHVIVMDVKTRKILEIIKI